MKTEINTPVGLGELVVTNNTDEVLIAHGLGSCVGVTAYDPIKKIGAMLHVMLPEAQGIPTQDLQGKYAVTGIPLMLNEMEKLGAATKHLTIRIAGGATMFSINSNGGIFNIGPRNIEMVKKIIKKRGLPIAAEDVGKNYGRTMFFYIESGKVMIKSILYGYKEL